MKKIIVLLSFLITTVAVFAQTDIQLSQQINNRVLFNPAATGQSGCYNFTILAREQWTGIKEAPSTQLFNFNKYFKGPKLGIGFTFIYDRVGVEKTLNAKASISYHVWLTNEMTLSFGLGMGIINRSVNGAGLTYEDPNDPNAVIIKDSKLKPDFDFGIEYNWKRLNIGVASTHLITSFKKSTIYKVPRHYYTYAKYAIKVSPSVEIIPALSWNCLGNIHIFEINAMTNIKDRVFAGLSYRIDDAFIIMAGVKIIDQVRLSYAYDIKAGSIKYGSTKGSHEIMLLCRFGCDKQGPLHPRFFN
ncbi:MAG: type IX secretion system membrane protein PorP/SprF [Bacteroidales bacterium]|jgi:type IX secretion system PorP/SprF family membrane protein|nr:type IX secretion system membrane protein PorP/SprF [Bacteroidales bacterium]MDD4214495.1 type IX secretion system membrane protein PorP/SprF [Bacteroidales bacterium]